MAAPFDLGSFAIKSAELQPEAVSQVADEFVKAGTALNADMDSLASVWSGLQASYRGPEQELVYAVMAPAEASAGEIKSAFSQAGKAITAYATSLQGFATRLRGLEDEARALNAEAANGYQVSMLEAHGPIALAGDASVGGVVDVRTTMVTVEWHEYEPAVAKRADIQRRLVQLFHEIGQAVAECANTLTGLTTDADTARAARNDPDSGGGPPRLTAPTLPEVQAAQPFGPPVSKTPNCTDNTTGAAGDLWNDFTGGLGFSDTGWDPMVPVKGLFDTAVAAGSLSPIGLPSMMAGGPIGEYQRQATWNTASGLADMVNVDINPTTNGGNPFWQYVDNPVRTTTNTALSLVTLAMPFIAPFKIASMTGRAAGVAARTANGAARVADAFVPGGSALVAGGSRGLAAAGRGAAAIAGRFNAALTAALPYATGPRFAFALDGPPIGRGGSSRHAGGGTVLNEAHPSRGGTPHGSGRGGGVAGDTAGRAGTGAPPAGGVGRGEPVPGGTAPKPTPSNPLPDANGPDPSTDSRPDTGSGPDADSRPDTAPETVPDPAARGPQALDPDGLAAKMLDKETIDGLSLEQIERINDAENLAAKAPWRTDIERGNIFNIVNESRYQVNDLAVTPANSPLTDTGLASPNQSTYNRIDSVNFDKPVIVERKHTQLANTSPQNAIRGINQLVDKYDINRYDIVIGDTPRNRSQLESIGRNPDDWIGKPLRGQHVLEVPVQNSPPPLKVLEHARSNSVQVIDVKGTRWQVSPDGRSIVETRADGTSVVHERR